MYCYIPTKEDKQIGDILGWTPALTAIIRGIYDERMDDVGKPRLDQMLDLKDAEQLKSATEILKKFNTEDIDSRLSHMKKFHAVRTADTRTAIQHYSSADLRHRLSMMSQLFRSVVYQVKNYQRGRSITEICNGYMENGQFMGGQFAIFEEIRKFVLGRAEYWTSQVAMLEAIDEASRTPEQKKLLEDYRHYSNEYTKMIAHWDELVTMTRSKLRDSMGIMLGNKVDYAADLNLDLTMQQLHFDAEESHKEHWLEKQDEISAFASTAQAVRILLGSIPAVDEYGNTLIDDLGFPIMMDPTQAHREIMDALRGMTSSKQMERKLMAASNDIPWVKNLYKELYRTDVDNSRLRTQFYVDFRKTFQLYGALQKEMKGRQAIYKTIILNRVKDAIKGNTKARVAKGLVLDEGVSLYSDKAVEFEVANPKKKGETIKRKGAAVNIENLYKFVKDLDAHFTEREDSEGRTRVYYERLRPKAKINFLSRVFKSLGLEVDEKSIRKLLRNNNDSSDLIARLVKLGERIVNESQFNGFLELYEQDKSFKTSADIVEKLDDWDGYLSYIEFLEDDVFAEHFNEISRIITKYSANQQYESKSPWKDAYGNNIMLFSDVQPSYLADKIDEIRNFINERDMEGLVKYVQANWGVSSYFYDGTRYLNRWLSDLLNDGLDSEGFGKNFEFMKFVGEVDKINNVNVNFENFTSVKHIISMISEFTGIRQITNGESSIGKYPVFILGDANVQKYITAPIYPLEKAVIRGAKQVIDAQNQTVRQEGGTRVAPIIDSLWDVFKQEMIEWRLSEDMKRTMNEKGYDEVVSYKAKTTLEEKKGIFQFLTFLNEDYVDAKGNKGTFYKQLKDIEVDGTYNEKQVKLILQRGMDDAFQKFLDRMADFGVIKGERLSTRTDDTREGKYDRFTDPQNLFAKDLSMMPNVKDGVNRTDAAKLRDFLREFFWNTKFATIQQMQIFTISPAFYKDTKELQKRYKELHAPGNALDIFAEYWDPEENMYKRYSENGKETCVYVDDVALNAAKYNPEYTNAVAYQYGRQTEEIRERLRNGEKVEDIEADIIKAGRSTEVYEKYALTDEDGNIVDGKDPNSATDGQGWRSFTSYRKVMGMAGLWTEEMETFYRKYMQLRRDYPEGIPQDEINKLMAESPVVFQPIKPYMYGIEHYGFDNGDVGLIPVQHKYSEAVLIPELLPKGSKLRDMAMWMEEKNVDLIASSYVVKTGQWGSVDIKGKRNYTDASGDHFDLTDALNKAAIHEFNYNDYRIQTNVPDHSNTDRLFGTQLRKLIMANLNMKEDSDYSSYLHGRTVNIAGEPVKLTGRNLLAFYNSIIVSNILDSFEEFADELNDAEKLADILTQSIINNSRFSMNCIDAFAMTGDSKFMMPLFEAAFEHDTASMIFSIFKNRVNRQKIRGGSAVQVSNLGINEIKADEANKFGIDYGGLKDRVSLRNSHNVIYSEIATPFDYVVKQKTKNGTKEIHLDYAKYVDENGIPRYGSEFGGDITQMIADLKENKDSMSEEEYNQKLSELEELEDLCQSYSETVNGETHYFLPLIEQHYKGALTRIAYRIPTENDYSMVMGRIVRFTHHTAGGTMYVPAHGTSRSGWDFDIDKLYFMMFEYVMKEADTSMIDTESEEFKAFAKKHPSLSQEKLLNNYVWSQFYQNPRNSAVKGLLEFYRDRVTNTLKYLQDMAESYSQSMSESTPIDELKKAVESELTVAPDTFSSDEEFIKAVKDLHLPSNFNYNGFNIGTLINKAEEFIQNRVVTKEQWIQYFKDNLGEKSLEFKLIKEHITDKGVNFNAIKELYKYWDFAGLEGKPSDAFQQTLESMVPVAELDEYDVSKTALENSRAARNNMLLNIIQHRLMDEETFMARNTPSEFTNASAGARSLRELTMGDYKTWGWLNEETMEFDEEAFNKAISGKDEAEDYDPEPNYDPTDPWTIVLYNAQNQLAAKLIGIMANQNANHALASLMDKIELNVPIEFCGHTVEGDGIGADLLHKDLRKDIAYSDPLRAEWIRKNVAEYLAASVDAVKDPVLNYLNLNTLTAAPGVLLARLGYTSEEIGLLFNQPIIKEICDEYFKEGFRSADNVVAKVISKYSSKKSEDGSADFSKNALRMNILKQRIASDKARTLMDLEANDYETNSFIDSQVRIAEMFSNILKASAELNSFITATKFTAANAVGTTPGAFYNQQMRIEKYIKKIEDAENSTDEDGPTTMLSMVTSKDYNPGTLDSTKPVQYSRDSELVKLLFTEDKSQRAANKHAYLAKIINNPFAYEQAMFDANRRCMEILEKYYPYGTEAYKQMRDRGNRLMSNGMLREDEINALHQEYMVYMLSQQEGSIFDGGAKHPTNDGTEMTNRVYYVTKFAEELWETLEDPANAALKELPIFSSMNFDVDAAGNWSLRILGGTSRADYSRDEIIESWDHLSKMGEGGAKLARDLFMYCFYNHGFRFGYDNFIYMCPVSVKESINVYEATDDTPALSYRDFLYSLLDQTVNMSNVSLNEFYKLFIANHSEDYRWAYRPYGDAKKSLIEHIVQFNPDFSTDTYGNLRTVYQDGSKKGKPIESFTLDLDRFDDQDDAKQFLRADDEAKAQERHAFVPAIVIGDRLYIADNGDLFNITNGKKKEMTYRLYNAIGSNGERMAYLSPSEYDSLWRYSENLEVVEEPGSPEVRIDEDIELDSDIESMSRDEAIEEYVKTVAKVYEEELVPNLRSSVGDAGADALIANIVGDLRRAIEREGSTEERIKSIIQNIRDKDCKVKNENGLWVRPC